MPFSYHARASLWYPALTSISSVRWTCSGLVHQTSAVCSPPPCPQVVYRVYARLGLVLFALEVSSPKTGRVRVAINPAGFVIPPVSDYRVHGYVIAENSVDAMRVTKVGHGGSAATVDVSSSFGDRAFAHAELP